MMGDLLHYVVYSLVVILSLFIWTRDRKLRAEIETMKKLRDAQIAEYQRVIKAANLKAHQSGEEVQAQRSKMVAQIRRMERMIWTLISILGTGLLGTLLGALLK